MKSINTSDIPRKLLGITFAVVLLIIASPGGVYAQKAQATPTRQSSIDAFTGGNFEDALAGFSQLLEKYPKDPLYKFYSGASLVMLNRDPERALQLLSQSVNGASVVRTLPPESYFYLGRAQQMCGKFPEAITSFNSYTDEVGRKAAREMGVPGFIQECENRKGMVTAAPVTTPVQAQAPPPPSNPVASPAVAKTTMGDTKPAEKKQIEEAEKKPVVNKPPEITKLPAEYDALLDEALKLQYSADSLNRIAAEQKNQIEQLPESDKSAARVKIYQNEMKAASLQKTADAKYDEAQTRMNNGKSPVVKADSALAEKKPAPVIKEEPKKQDNALIAETTPKVVAPASKIPVVVSLFQVLPKDAVYPDEAIKVDPVVPAGLIYRIQLAVFKNPVPPSFFKGITPVYGFKVQGTDKTNYYAGMFRRAADAKKALIDVKTTGFKDAFIIALADKKAVSMERAAVLENEWGSKSLIDMSQPGAVTDTIPPALVFRVEVARSLKPLKPEVIESLKTTAGDRGLEVLHLSDGNLVYLIGKFITFESAAEYADLLIRNNYRGAKVVAWLGNKEVPVETAKQLFKGL